MTAPSVLRVVRPTDNLATIVPMYVGGLGFTVLAQFTDHEGFDGAILGHPQQPVPLRVHRAAWSPRGHGADQGQSPGLLPAGRQRVGDTLHADARAGFRAVPSNNPYWDRQGRTFEDVDGYRVVLQNGAWER